MTSRTSLTDRTPDDAGGPTGDARPRRGDWTTERVALAVFLVYLGVAFGWLAWQASSHWFAGEDDWGLLMRNVHSVDDLVRPQHQHWSTFPILVFQGIYALVGLHSYVPYVLPVIALRLGVAGLARVVMRRIGVGPWVATATASLLVLFGAGGQDYLLAVQVSMMGSMACGLGQLILADHDGRIDRRDWIGLGLGFVGIMSSGIGPIFIVVVGVAALLRRGWRAAAFHAGPVAATYALWYLHYKDIPLQEGGFALPNRAPLGTLLQWVWWGLSGAVVSLGHVAGLSILLTLLLVGGLLLAWAPLDWSTFRRRASAVIGLLLGAAVLLAAAGNERFMFGVDVARSSRYVDMCAVLLAPALAVAADAVVRRWRASTPFVLALLVIPIPLNIGDYATTLPPDSFYRGIQLRVLGVGNSPYRDLVPPTFEPAGTSLLAPGVDMAFLRDAKAHGKLPDIDVSPADRGPLTLSLAVQQEVLFVPLDTCRNLTEPEAVTLPAGAHILFDAPIGVAAEIDGAATPAATYAPGDGAVLTMRAGGVPIIVTPQPGRSYQICDPAP